MGKVLTKEELAIHIIDNIEKNGQWVNDLEFGSGFSVLKSENDLGDMLRVLKDGDIELNYMVAESPEEKKVDTYKIGDRFTLDKEEEFILCQVDYHQCCLVSLMEGNRWTDPVKVDDPKTITQEEFYRMCGTRKGEFAKL